VLFEKLESGDFPEAVEELVAKNKIDLNDCYKVNLFWSSCYLIVDRLTCAGWVSFRFSGELHSSDGGGSEGMREFGS